MDRLGEITVPTLVMAGRDDFVFPPEGQRELAAGIPDARLRIIERAGHNPHSEQPAEVMEAVSDFLSAGRRRAGRRGSRRGEVRGRCGPSACAAITGPTRSRRPIATWSSARRWPPSPRSCPTAIPQTSVVWCDFDGECVRVNTMRGFAKERNMRRNPRVTLCCYDPRQPLRYLEVRGTVVEMTEAGAAEHLDAPRLQLRRPADPLLRRRHPGPLRRDRDPGPVPDPAHPRRRARRDGEGGRR